MENRIGWVITNLWNLLIKDLEDTLRHVTRQVLEEGEGTSKDLVLKRARGLAVLAEIFQVRGHRKKLFRSFWQVLCCRLGLPVLSNSSVMAHLVCSKCWSEVAEHDISAQG